MKQKNQPINMYAMQGYCPSKVFLKQIFWASESLTYANAEVQNLQQNLINFLYQRLFRQSKKHNGGFVLHSGSEANEIALLIAKRKSSKKKKLVIFSNLTHSSVLNACAKLNLKPYILDTDPKTFQVDKKTLIRIIKENSAKILAINFTYGTTQTGTTEDIVTDPEVIRLIRKNNIWLHIDAAYGGFVINAADRMTKAWQSIFSVTDSITIDPHKFIGTWGCGVLLLKNVADKKLIGTEVQYYKGIGTALGTTRSAFPAAIALSIIKDLKIAGLKNLAEASYKKSEYVKKVLRKNSIELLTEPATPNIAIKIPTAEALEKIYAALEQFGFSLAKVKITGKNYLLFGLRLAVTPKPEMSWKNIKKFVKDLIAIYQSL